MAIRVKNEEPPETVVKYLSCYTYRIAISNTRIIKVDEQFVYFHWKDYADNNRKKVMKLEGAEFLRRFLRHVLPGGFMRIRHFGFLVFWFFRELCPSGSRETSPPITQKNRDTAKDHSTDKTS